LRRPRNTLGPSVMNQARVPDSAGTMFVPCLPQDLMGNWSGQQDLKLRQALDAAGGRSYGCPPGDWGAPQLDRGRSNEPKKGIGGLLRRLVKPSPDENWMRDDHPTLGPLEVLPDRNKPMP